MKRLLLTLFITCFSTCAFTLPCYKEKVLDGWEQVFEVKKIYCNESTNFQDIIIFETPAFGKVLAIDGIIQLSEFDEFIYHEMITHVPLLSHPNPKTALVIGGGDGGVVRELLKHQTIEKVIWIDIDQKAIELFQRHLPSVCQNIMKDPRLKLVICDGFDYLKTSEENFDIIICDSTDPIGAGEILFTKEFFFLCKNHLTKQGIFVNQIGLPAIDYSFFPKNIYKDLNSAFDTVKFYQASLPIYLGGPIVFGLSTNDETFFLPKVLELKEKTKNLSNLRYYTEEVHLSSFVLPKFIHQKLYKF